MMVVAIVLNGREIGAGVFGAVGDEFEGSGNIIGDFFPLALFSNLVDNNFQYTLWGGSREKLVAFTLACVPLWGGGFFLLY